MLLLMRPFELQVQVRYAETDAMGVVHHSRYFVWLELSRIEWLKHLGLNYKEMEKQGFFIPVVQADLSYKMPVFFDDMLRIVLLPPEDFRRVKFTINYEILRGQDQIARGFTSHAFINAQRRLIPPPDFFIKKLQEQS